MYSFDASSMIYAWDNYPPDSVHFASLWEWFAVQVQVKKIVISRKAFEEVSHKIPECGQWLQDNNIEILNLTAKSLLLASEMKQSLGIFEGKYSKGVGENDLFIIAIAKESNTILVSEEARQAVLPTNKSNYKIPAVCNMQSVAVECRNFLSLLKLKS